MKANQLLAQTWPFDATDDNDARKKVAEFITQDKRRTPERLFREVALACPVNAKYRISIMADSQASGQLSQEVIEFDCADDPSAITSAKHILEEKKKEAPTFNFYIVYLKRIVQEEIFEAVEL